VRQLTDAIPLQAYQGKWELSLQLWVELGLATAAPPTRRDRRNKRNKKRQRRKARVQPPAGPASPTPAAVHAVSAATMVPAPTPTELPVPTPSIVQAPAAAAVTVAPAAAVTVAPAVRVHVPECLSYVRDHYKRDKKKYCVPDLRRDCDELGLSTAGDCSELLARLRADNTAYWARIDTKATAARLAAEALVPTPAPPPALAPVPVPVPIQVPPTGILVVFVEPSHTGFVRSHILPWCSVPSADSLWKKGELYQVSWTKALRFYSSSYLFSP
jgi:hypothetical protein